MSKSIVEWVWTDDGKWSSDGYVGLVGCYGVYKLSQYHHWRATFCGHRIGEFATSAQAKRACEKHLPGVIDDIKDVDSTLRRERENERNYGIE